MQQHVLWFSGVRPDRPWVEERFFFFCCYIIGIPDASILHFLFSSRGIVGATESAK